MVFFPYSIELTLTITTFWHISSESLQQLNFKTFFIKVFYILGCVVAYECSRFIGHQTNYSGDPDNGIIRKLDFTIPLFKWLKHDVVSGFLTILSKKSILKLDFF